jgi:hypothetical protein
MMLWKVGGCQSTRRNPQDLNRRQWKGILLRTTRHEDKAGSTGIALLRGVATFMRTAATKNSGCSERNYKLKKITNLKNYKLKKITNLKKL